MKGKSNQINPSEYGLTKCVPLGTLARKKNTSGKDYFALDLNGYTNVILIPKRGDVAGREEILLDAYLAQPDPNAPPQDVIKKSSHNRR